MKTEQIEQITHFLSAYPKDVVEAWKTGEIPPEQISTFLSAYPDDVVEAWRTGETPVIMEGRVTDVPLAQNYNELTEEAGIIENTKCWIPHPPIKDFEGRQVRNGRKEKEILKRHDKRSD